MTARFQKIDDQNRPDHFHLTPDDECYFLYEYTSGKNYQFSATNSLISNLKKKPSLANTPQYKYKHEAMRACAKDFGEAINSKWLDGATLVPVPPSKAVGDVDYDDRIHKVCQAIPSASPVDVRDLVIQTKSLNAAHESSDRPTVEDLLAVYQIDETKAEPALKRIAIVDDVLTAGTHFRAVKSVLEKRFPGVPIVGFFVARRVLPNPFDEFEDETL
ncbi:hypothetical protein DW352_18005 [Pseudolabrys taiwanensis]|uniref:Phosphoribosyltransferase n=1 Tax=Pseudolabrys taiwanensis TaxID=331696 RepID=A0A345ZZA2_9HYPH|nr:hypothetical protein [Pseudolabrys taiwanensis]AXK82249.1 hypothetical protein DW352_18005 [Pseudolabrys taiwanensis]